MSSTSSRNSSPGNASALPDQTPGALSKGATLTAVCHVCGEQFLGNTAICNNCDRPFQYFQEDVTLLIEGIVDFALPLKSLFTI